jgi:hypothetical protein
MADAAIEAQILAVQTTQLMNIVTVLEESRKSVAQAREIKEITAEAYHAVNDLRHLSWDELRFAAFQALNRAYPQFREIYGDLQNISDLRRRSPKARATLDGIVHEMLWGPLQQNIDEFHDNSDLIADTTDHLARHQLLRKVNRSKLEQLEIDCEKGQGACKAASERSMILTGLMISDLHESVDLLNEDMRKDRIEKQHALLRDHRLTATVLAEVNLHVMETLGVKRPHCAGDCLYRKYAYKAEEALQKRIRAARAEAQR